MSNQYDVNTDSAEQRILQQRAAAFARPSVQRTAAGDEVLIFKVLRERFALPLAAVAEIARVTAITPLPGAASPVAGVVAWRGRGVLIIDVAQPARSDIVVGEETRVIMIGERGRVIGFVADEIENVTRIDLGELTHTASESWRAQVIRGLSSDAVLILDPAQLLRRFAAPGTPSR